MAQHDKEKELQSAHNLLEAGTENKDVLNITKGDLNDDNIDDFNDDAVRNSSVGGGIANLTNTIIGTGVLGLPFAFSECGWALSILLMAFSLVSSVVSIHFVSKCCHRIGGTQTSCGAISHAAYPWLGTIGDLSVIFTCIGACISYLIVIGDLVPQFVMQLYSGDSAILLSRQFWIGLVWAVLGIPLACMPNVDKLKFTSALAIIAVLYVMCLVFLYSIQVLDPCEGKDLATCEGEKRAVSHDGLGVIRALPMFIFAFCCQTNVPEVYNVLVNPRVKRMDMVGIGSLGLVMCIYMVFGMCGLFTYGTNVSSNILKDYPVTIPVSVARLMLAFVVAVSYPLLFHPTRNALVNIVNLSFVAANKGEKVAQGTKGSKGVWWGVTVVLLGVTFGLAMTVTDLGLVFGIIGATASTAITFILPSAAYLKLFVYNDPKEDEIRGWAPPSQGSYEGLKKWVAWFLMVFGIIFMPTAVAVMFV